MCIANEVKWEIRQVDVKTAYLHRELDEEIYVAAPEGLNVPEGHALCLWKALYGIKQAAKQWHKKLSSVLAEFGLKQISNEPNTFFVRKVTKGELKILVRATLPLTIPSVIAKQISSNALFPHKGKWLKSGHYVLPVGIPAHEGRSRAQCRDATI